MKMENVLLKELILATHNQGKVHEFEVMLDGLVGKLSSALEHKLDEPEETETTFVGNALLKAHAAVKVTGLPCLADDSGLCVDGLDGAPGIYSARWAETDNGRDFNIAMQRIHDDLGGIDGTQRAYFMVVLALVYPDGAEEVFEGRVNGKLCWPMRGEQGHGYDPMFVADGYDISFAEMDVAKKNAISHRAVAVEKLKKYLSDNE